MTHTIQVFQLILFILPILALLVIGGLILLKPVSIINQRWYLAVFLPLLIANSLVILENMFLSEVLMTVDWRLWLIVVADVVLLVGIAWYFRGILVYGIELDVIETVLVDTFNKAGYEVSVKTGEKRFMWGSVKDARILSLAKANQEEDIWVTERFNEVLIRSDSRAGLTLLHTALPALRRVEAPYDIKTHATGILYLVLAVVFAVLTWIFFFEPRFILIS